MIFIQNIPMCEQERCVEGGGPGVVAERREQRAAEWQGRTQDTRTATAQQLDDGACSRWHHIARARGSEGTCHHTTSTSSDRDAVSDPAVPELRRMTPAGLAECHQEMEAVQLKANSLIDDSLESTRRMLALCEEVSATA